VDTYLQGERRSELRREYVGGEVCAMGDASDAHNLIAMNLETALHGHLRRADGWRPVQLTGGDRLDLTSVGLDLPVTDLYEGVDLQKRPDND
jgi:hypothetical protein